MKSLPSSSVLSQQNLEPLPKAAAEIGIRRSTEQRLEDERDSYIKSVLNPDSNYPEANS